MAALPQIPEGFVASHLNNGAPNGYAEVGKTPAGAEVLEQELLVLMLRGLTVKECAAHMRASYAKCCKIARSGAFLLKVREKSDEIAQRMIDEMTNTQVEFAKKLEAASEQALDEMISMIDAIPGASSLKYRICQDLLDRDPRASRQHKVEQKTQHDFISPAVLIHAAATARELDTYRERKALDVGNPSPSTVDTTDR